MPRNIDYTGKEDTRYFERTTVTSRYLEDIKHLPILTRDEEKELLYEAQNGNIAARNRIVESQLRFVVAVVKHTNTSVNINDLISEGNLGVLEAINNFDVNSGLRFGTYAVHWIRKYINAYIMKNSSIVRPKNAQKLHTMTRRYRDRFFREFERYPCDEELRQYMEEDGIKFSDKQIFSTQVLSIDTTTDDELYSEETMMFHNATATNSVETDLYDFDNEIMVQRFLGNCKEDEKDIVTQLYGIGRNEETVQGIAAIKGIGSKKVKHTVEKVLNRINREKRKRK